MFNGLVNFSLNSHFTNTFRGSNTYSTSREADTPSLTLNQATTHENKLLVPFYRTCTTPFLTDTRLFPNLKPKLFEPHPIVTGLQNDKNMENYPVTIHEKSTFQQEI